MKNKVQVFTKETNKSVPSNMVFIKNKFGWLFLVNEEAQWFVNHTNDFKDCPADEDSKAIKAIINQIKVNDKILKEKEEEIKALEHANETNESAV